MSPSHDFSPLLLAEQGLLIASSQLGNEEHRVRVRAALQQRRERLEAERNQAEQRVAVKRLRRDIERLNGVLSRLVQSDSYTRI